MTNALRLEFHCHTSYSPDSLVRLEDLLEACREKSIHRIVITDHNTLQGALAARALDPQRVIVGEEIMTTQGELLAAFVQEEIPPGLSPEEAIQRLRQQGAFISVSHPFDTFRKGRWTHADLLNIAPLVDAIEVFNARCINPEHNRLASQFAAQHGLLGTVGSDAHTVFEIGKAIQEVPDFENAVQLKAALQHARYTVSLSPAWIHFSSRYAVWRKRLA